MTKRVYHAHANGIISSRITACCFFFFFVYEKPLENWAWNHRYNSYRSSCRYKRRARWQSSKVKANNPSPSPRDNSLIKIYRLIGWQGKRTQRRYITKRYQRIWRQVQCIYSRLPHYSMGVQNRTRWLCSNKTNWVPRARCSIKWVKNDDGFVLHCGWAFACFSSFSPDKTCVTPSSPGSRWHQL